MGTKGQHKGGDNRKGNNRILKKKKRLGKHITAHQKTLIRICVFLSELKKHELHKRFTDNITNSQY